MLKKVFILIKKHKITFIILCLAALAVVYLILQKAPDNSNGVSYETTKVTKGNIETVVSATGQVGDTNEISITSEASGEITAVYIKKGDEVTAGQKIAQIDTSDLENEIYQAQLAVETAELNLDKLKEPADEYDITKAENELKTAQNDLKELKLTQEHAMDTVKEEKANAIENRDALSKKDENYDTQYQTYTSQIKEAKRKIEEYKLSHPIALEEAEDKIEEKEKALEIAKEGADEQDIRLQEISVEEKKSKLNDLILERSDYTITSPKDGIIAALNISEGENISSSGASSNSDANGLATLISKTKNAEITINEVDVPQVSVGQKVNITFDALEDLEITGSVEDIDLIGTVDQGVVYNTVTIAFDTQDERVNNGMTVNTDIITNSKDDILIVPISAVTEQSDGDYIQILDRKNPKNIEVETGITDDINIEIIEGLEEGEEVITETNTVNNSKSSKDEETDDSRSLFQMGGGKRPE